jgi:hypothetical protein
LILKTTLAATFCPIGNAGLLAAQTATTKTLIGTAAAGDQVVDEVTYMILPIPMTDAQIAAVNAVEGQGGGTAPALIPIGQ